MGPVPPHAQPPVARPPRSRHPPAAALRVAHTTTTPKRPKHRAHRPPVPPPPHAALRGEEEEEPGARMDGEGHGTQENRGREAEQSVRELRRAQIVDNFFLNASVNPARYRLLSVLGEGAFGVVCRGEDTHEPVGTNARFVAIKRLQRVMDSPPMATRLLREVKVLRLLAGHDNIIRIKDILVPGESNFNHAFVVFDLMPADLGSVLRSETTLLPSHVKFFLLQILKALAFLHESNILHRDLKPGNLLVNDSPPTLKICDFGMARAAFELPDDMNMWTDYVTTRSYRAPELILTPGRRYNSAIDIWSVGCIFAEMLARGHVLFPGRDAHDQIARIVRVTGRPPLHIIEAVPDRALSQYLRTVPFHPQDRLDQILGDRNTSLLDPSDVGPAYQLLRRLLDFDPAQRISAAEALQSPYFDEFRGLVVGRPVGMPVAPSEFRFETLRDTDALRREFLSETALYHRDCTELVVHPQFGYGVGQVDRAVESMPRPGAPPALPRNTMPVDRFRQHAHRAREFSTMYEDQLSDLSRRQ